MGPAAFKKSVAETGVGLYLINPGNTALNTENSSELESLMLQTAFLRVALGKSEEIGLQKLATINSDIKLLEEVASDLEKTLRQIEVPKEWAEVEVEPTKEALPTDMLSNSFVSFEKTEEEPPSVLRSWQKAAKGLLFREAYSTENALRPELPTKTFTVHVKENRRLTPVTYERNIFHIEFDLGTSGLKYNIGEALEFMKFYGLNAEDVVEVPSRSIFQSLVQNIDIFGKP